MLQVQSPGTASLESRVNWGFQPLASVSGEDVADPSRLLGRVLADPKTIIRLTDEVALRVWARGVAGFSIDKNISLDELRSRNLRALVKLACLYLQGAYWGGLPDDWIGDSHPSSHAYNWPNVYSPLEQQIYSWKVEYKPVSVPSYLAEDTSGRLWVPQIRPQKLVQKYDTSQSRWRVLNLGGTDRYYFQRYRNDAWQQSGWDFWAWAQTSGFAEVLQVVGIAVAAVAAACTGGIALAGGASIAVAISSATAAAQTVSQISSAVQGFAGAIAAQDIGGALSAMAVITQTAFGIDIRNPASYQPGLDYFRPMGDQLAAYFKPIMTLGNETASTLFKTISAINGNLTQLSIQAGDLLRTISVDTTRRVTGIFPDAFLKQVATLSTSELGQISAKLSADFDSRAQEAIKTMRGQVPPFVLSYYDRAMSGGYEKAVEDAMTVPWFGRFAHDAGTVSAALAQQTQRHATIDLNALTSRQKRALFFGDVVAAVGGGVDPSALVNAAEFIRQSDLLWAEIVGLAERYQLKPPAVRGSAYAPITIKR